MIYNANYTTSCTGILLHACSHYVGLSLLYFSFPQSELPDEILDDEEDENDEDSHHESRIHPALRLLLVFLIFWGFTFRISSAALNALILFLHHYLKLIASWGHTSGIEKLSEQCPKTLQTVHQ